MFPGNIVEYSFHIESVRTVAGSVTKDILMPLTILTCKFVFTNNQSLQSQIMLLTRNVWLSYLCLTTLGNLLCMRSASRIISIWPSVVKYFSLSGSRSLDHCSSCFNWSLVRLPGISEKEIYFFLCIRAN